MKPIVVVGTGLSGFNTVKELRKLAPDIPIVMLTSDDGRNYSKPMLSNGFAKGKTADELSMGTAEETASRLHVEVRAHVEVTGIDREHKKVQLAQGELEYDKLVLALGAAAWTPPLKGNATDAVFSVNNITDYGYFRAALAGKKKVLILGGGLIGCEFANDLAGGGFDVELVEPQGRCLPLLLPEAASRAVAEGLEEVGVVFHFGPLAQAVDHGDSGKLVTSLSDGTKVESDIVFSAIGLRPHIALAKAAGLDVNRGIRTDQFLRTSDPDIYALGDCAEVAGHVLPFVLPLMAASRALAKTLAGEETKVSYGVMPVTIKTPACPVVVLPVAAEAEGDWQVEVDGRNVRALFRAPDGSLKGYALTADAAREKMKLNQEIAPLMP
jgi:rubredoxin-NAD+ reductase